MGAGCDGLPDSTRDYDRAGLGGFLSELRRYASAARRSSDDTWPSTISSRRFIASETFPALSFRSALASSDIGDRTSLCSSCVPCAFRTAGNVPQRTIASCKQKLSEGCLDQSGFPVLT